MCALSPTALPFYLASMLCVYALVFSFCPAIYFSSRLYHTTNDLDGISRFDNSAVNGLFLEIDVVPTFSLHD